MRTVSRVVAVVEPVGATLDPRPRGPVPAPAIGSETDSCATMAAVQPTSRATAVGSLIDRNGCRTYCMT